MSYLHNINFMLSSSIAYPEKNDHIYTDLYFFITTKDLSSNNKTSSGVKILTLPAPNFSSFVSYYDVDPRKKVEWIEKLSPGLIESIEADNIQKLQNGNF